MFNGFRSRGKTLYNALEQPARKLGAAFQKVNFLRDVNADFNTLGRSYFPNVDLNNFSSTDKLNIENDIEADFLDALEGIKKLPKSSRLGVFIAYRYYLSLFYKIKSVPAQHIMNTRVRINNPKKLYLACHTMLINKINLL